MVYDNQGNILVQDRLDPDWPGVTFPGGHVEPGESFTKAVIREVWEETGLIIEHPRLCGLKQFPEEDGTHLQTHESSDQSSPAADSSPTHCA